MAKKINEIKAELQAATFEMLPFFMEEYKEDERAGVKHWFARRNRNRKA